MLDRPLNSETPYLRLQVPEKALLLSILDRALRDLIIDEFRGAALRWFKGKTVRSRHICKFTYLSVVEYLADEIGCNEIKYIEDKVKKAERGMLTVQDYPPIPPGAVSFVRNRYSSKKAA